MSVRLLMALALFAPAPLAAQQAEAAAAAAPAPARSVPLSWTADRRDFEVGDLLTVIVDESTLAVQDRSTSASEDRSTVASLNGALRGAGTTKGGDLTARTGIGGSSVERGQARRQDRLTAEITVRVTAVEAGGTLRVEGSKSLVIDDRQQTVTLTGLVRPADVSPQNVIDSWRIGDVNISYHTDGRLSKPRKSIIGRVLGVIWP